MSCPTINLTVVIPSEAKESRFESFVALRLSTIIITGPVIGWLKEHQALDVSIYEVSNFDIKASSLGTSIQSIL